MIELLVESSVKSLFIIELATYADSPVYTLPTGYEIIFWNLD